MAAAVIALIWLGMLVGVSFIATPVKFVVADLSLPVALQVGQATFHLFAKVEWVFAAALMSASALSRRKRSLALTITLAMAAGVLVQTLWLLPALDTRVALIAVGERPPPSMHHALYAGMEGVKALLLAVAALCGLRRAGELKHPV